MDSSAELIVFVIGAPGSGKGTLCKKLSKEYGFSHLSVGDVLRRLVSLPDCDVDIVNSVQSGQLISIEALAPLLKSQVDKEKVNGRRKILVDGFPRRLDQAAPVETLVGKPTLVLFFDCPEIIAEQRFLTRKLAGRETDDVPTFRKRYQEFNKLNPSVVDHYRKRGILLQIDTSEDTEVSYQKLMHAWGERNKWM